MTERRRFVGLAIRRSSRDIAVEPFFHAVEAGLESMLLPRGLRVLRQLVDDDQEEVAGYRRWADGGLVAGVVLADTHADDPRPAALGALGLPTVVLGDPVAGFDASSVRTDNHDAMVEAVLHLAGLGHRRIAHVTGPQRLLHTTERSTAFSTATEAAGVSGVQLESDYSAAGGAAATERLLEAPTPPSAIVFDNDVMAVAALERAMLLGWSVPRDLSLLAWDDSVLCRLAEPAMSAMSHDVRRAGELAGEAIIALLDRGVRQHLTAPGPVLVERGSTAAPSSEPQVAA